MLRWYASPHDSDTPPTWGIHIPVSRVGYVGMIKSSYVYYLTLNHSHFCWKNLLLLLISRLFEDTTRLHLQDAVARAGLSATPTANTQCGSNVTLYQALINDWIEFTCDPPVVARYVSIDIPRLTSLILCEVKVWACDLSPAGDFSSVMRGYFWVGRFPLSPYICQTLEIQP